MATREEAQRAARRFNEECPAQPEVVAAADARIITEANARGWTARDLFNWANSRSGRFYGDAWFGGATGTRLERFISETIELPRD